MGRRAGSLPFLLPSGGVQSSRVKFVSTTYTRDPWEVGVKDRVAVAQEDA